MKAAALIRVSTDEQELENQRAPLLELAEARGWALTWYEEQGVSGAARRRPVLEQLLDDVRARKVRAVAVVALDRLGRSMGAVIATVLELDRLGCTVVSLREPWLDTAGPTRSLLLAIFAWVAEQERAMLIERTNAGIARARQRGTRSGKPIGRPRANQMLLGAAARRVHQGASYRAASKEFSVSEASLRRYVAALAAPRNDEGPGEAQSASPEPLEASARQNPLPGGATRRHQKSTG